MIWLRRREKTKKVQHARCKGMQALRAGVPKARAHEAGGREGEGSGSEWQACVCPPGSRGRQVRSIRAGTGRGRQGRAC